MEWTSKAAPPEKFGSFCLQAASNWKIWYRVLDYHLIRMPRSRASAAHFLICSRAS